MEQTTSTNQTKQKMSTKNLVITGMFTAILCVLAQISIPVPPIPFTLSLFAIFLIGALLPPRLALLSVLAYDFLGVFGLPVFAGFKGGIQAVAGMTGGFIVAYPIMAFVTALFCKYLKKIKIFAPILGMLVSLILCYLIGSLWFTVVAGTSLIKALTLCVFPFVLFDAVKAGLAVSISIILKKTVFRYYDGN